MTSGERTGDLDEPTTDPAGIRRRSVMLGGAAAVGAVGLGSLANTAAAQAATDGRPHGITKTIRDLKHVVILMLENRSFDHYFGMIPGARGFEDRQMLQYPDGTNVFQQPDPTRPEGYVLPFRMDSARMNALGGWDLPHGWPDGQRAWNKGANNGWVQAKSPRTMGYFTEAEIPWAYAAAQAWTVCDHYHCSIFSATYPNRYYLMSGTIDPSGGNAPGRGFQSAYNNNGTGSPYTWPSFVEQLETAGASWNVYISRSPGTNYGLNILNKFKGVRDWFASSADVPFGATTEPAKTAAERGGYHFDANGKQIFPEPTPPNTDDFGPAYLNAYLQDFITDCKQDTLPLVSYLIPPDAYQEHPSGGERGGSYVSRVIEALASNPDVWNSTLLIVNFDEADGLYDHVLPPVPEAGTTDEFLPASGANPAGHIGPGPRVPALLISPWTRGGHSYSGVMDHTSTQQFIEDWLLQTQGLKVRNPNITEWRRSLLNNLGGALDFANPDFSVPALPNPAPERDRFHMDATLPPMAPPAVEQSMPVPVTSQGGVTPKPAPYQQHAFVTVHRGAGKVVATLSNDGGRTSTGVSMAVYPDEHFPFEATPYTVLPGRQRTHEWDTTATDGRYAFSIYGPDRFVRTFAGAVVATSERGIPVVDAHLETKGPNPVLGLVLRNEGKHELVFTLTRNDYEGRPRTVAVPANKSLRIDWPTDRYGFYDVIITDDSETGFKHRYAGRIAGHR
ncbi:alkaline phosphatase family protein [Kribbella sp. NPDC051770]|uniref:alkaline phosphatase family protein n=1 Tax=Kribbella sp. NPDC051770 TaxID=3155413 RepID=UPI00344697AD